MNYLEKQIFEKFKKENWEVKTLKEISEGNIFKGNQKISKNYKNDGNIPAIIVEDVLNSHITINKFQIFTNESLSNKNFFVEKNDLLIVICDFFIDNLGKSCAYLGDQKCITGGSLAVIKHSQNAKYLSYMLSTKYVKKQIKNLYQPRIRTEINTKNLEKIKIPVPSLSVQEEVVEFLDKFINLKQEMEVEMEVEMEKRSKQYEYYKELIFS